MFSDVSLHPAFSQKEIDRIRNQRLTQLLQQRDNPGALANKIFFSEVYGAKHPYGYIELGTEESLKAISRDDLAKFWSAGYVPENAALVVAGDISEAELRALAEKHFGKWKGSRTQVATPAVSSDAPRHVVVVDKPGSPQTELRVGHIGIARSNPDYVPVEVMNTMLGGLFSSRINMNLAREERVLVRRVFGLSLQARPRPVHSRQRRADGRYGARRQRDFLRDRPNAHYSIDPRRVKGRERFYGPLAAWVL